MLRRFMVVLGMLLMANVVMAAPADGEAHVVERSDTETPAAAASAPDAGARALPYDFDTPPPAPKRRGRIAVQPPEEKPLWRSDWTLMRGAGVNPVLAGMISGGSSLLMSAAMLGMPSLAVVALPVQLAVPFATNGVAGAVGAFAGGSAGTVLGLVIGLSVNTLIAGDQKMGLMDALKVLWAGAFIGTLAGNAIGSGLGTGIAAHLVEGAVE